MMGLLGKANKKYILIILITSLFMGWVKSFHYDKIKSLQKEIDSNQELFLKYDVDITTLKTALKQEKEACINSIAILKQATIKQDLEESINEIEEEKDNYIKTGVGKHTLTFPE